MKKIAIVQSNYIPWKGFFDMVAAVDEFILYDDMQYTRRDWRNRNQIKTMQGLQWLTVPVRVRGNYYQRIRDTEIDGCDWVKIHWKTLLQNYRKAPYFLEIADWLEPHYMANSHSHLSELNRCLMEAICNYLNIKTKISSSTEYTLCDGKTERLIDLCLQAGGDEYISGPSAQTYLQTSAFQKKGVKLTWFDYTGYPTYPQLWGEFTHRVSILDLLFNCGKNSSAFMLHVKPKCEFLKTLR